MAIEGLNEFLNELKKQGANIADVVKDLQTRLVLDIHNKLILSNPVDTGTSRYSWIITQSSPSTRVPAKGKYSWQQAQSRQNAVKSIQAYGVTYITNNQSYIERLNRGYSKQAPAGWIEECVSRAEAVLEAVIRDLQ
jgi:hypothetical protein